jgi:tripartite motif-containing protein 71
MRPPTRPRRVLTSLALALSATLLLPLSPAVAETPRFVETLAGRSVAAMYPSGLEWDAENARIVVADTGLDRILFYRLNGTKLGGFGRHGTGRGRFDSPRDVAIDGRGNIYVADAANNRIQKFSSRGAFRWQAGGLGSCDACLNTPIGVTWDRQNGVLLVASTGQSLLKAFEPDGDLAWRSPSGAQLGIAAPRDIARGPDGRIWVTDYKNHRVKAFDVSNAGVFRSTTPDISVGGNGNGLGQLNFPYNVAFSPSGNTLYVADTGNNRVARWDLTTTPPTPIDPPIGSKCPEAPDPCPDPPGDFGEIDTLRRVITAPRGRLVTADFWGNGLQVWSATNVGNGTTDAMLRQIELEAAPAPGFAQAFGVDVGGDGRVYAVDRLNQRLEGFTRRGRLFAVGGSRGTRAGRFSWPEAVAVAPNGVVWAADTRGDRVMRFPANLDDDLTNADVFGGTGDAVGEFNYIEDLDVAPDGRVYVADTRNSRIQVLNPGTGTFTVFPASVALSGPQGVAVTDRFVYVADTGSGRILRFDRTGGALQARSPAGMLSGPQGVAVGTDGTVWVADTRNHRVVHLSERLTNLRDTFGGRGGGRFEFDLPHTLAARGSRLYVADTFNHRVQVFNIRGL